MNHIKKFESYIHPSKIDWSTKSMKSIGEPSSETTKMFIEIDKEFHKSGLLLLSPGAYVLRALQLANDGKFDSILLIEYLNHILNFDLKPEYQGPNYKSALKL